MLPVPVASHVITRTALSTAPKALAASDALGRLFSSRAQVGDGSCILVDFYVYL